MIYFGNMFLRLILSYRLLYYRTEPQNTSELLAELLLHNERIKIGNKVISYTQWIEKGVYNLANFVVNARKLLTFTEFRNKYDIYMDFVTYSGLILSLKKYIHKTKIQVDHSSPSRFKYNRSLEDNIFHNKRYESLL